MNRLSKSSSWLLAAVLVAATRATAQQPAPDAALWPRPADARAFLETGVARGDKFWKTDHWEYKNQVHACTQMFFCAASAGVGGDRVALDHLRAHYHFIASAWNEDGGYWWDASSYMTQACMSLTLAMTLSSGSSVLDAGLRQDMEHKLRRGCVTVSRGATSQLGDDDLRACNQDSVGAAGLALASDYLHDPEVRRWALVKVRQILGASQGPFWTEGGLDVGYQGVGEPTFALAADVLWDDLTTDEKRRVTALSLRTLATRGINVESMRSETNLHVAAHAAASHASALLGRVDDPLLAENVARVFTEGHALDNDYLLFDTPSMAFYWGALRHADRIEALPKEDLPPGWGGAARLTMFRSEHGGTSIDDKTFLASESGLVAVFGDISRQLPAYGQLKRHVSAPPSQFDPGGLRYVGRGGRMFVWADGDMSFPRVWLGDSPAENADPARLLERPAPGFFGDGYTLVQAVNSAPTLLQTAKITARPLKAVVTQHFVMLGNVMLLILDADPAISTLPDPRYCLTVPVPGVENVHDKMLVWQSGNLVDAKDAAVQALVAVDGDRVAFAPSDKKAYLVNEDLGIWKEEKQLRAKPETPLGLAEIPLNGRKARWALLCCDGDRDRWLHLQASARLTDDPAGRLLRFKDGTREYAVLLPNASGKDAHIEISGGVLDLAAPAAGEVQCALAENGQLLGAMADASGLEWNHAKWFAAQAHGRARVSLCKGHTGWFVSVGEGDAAVTSPGHGTGVSLATGLPLEPSGFVHDERLWFAD